LLQRDSIAFSIAFSDDVIKEFFLALGFARVLDGKAGFTIAQLSDIVDKSQLRSPFMMAVSKRFKTLTDDIVIRICDLISQARKEFIDCEKFEEYHRHAAAMFNIGLQILNSSQIEANTTYLKQVFGSGTSPLDCVTLHNIPASSKVRFDFSGLTLNRASIKNFEDFFRCKFSDTCQFIASKIRTGMPKPLKTEALQTNFTRCDYRSGIPALNCLEGGWRRPEDRGCNTAPLPISENI
jgi:predicted MPP superfamily phosphohydrolase